jgi:hypothetical protein
MASAQYGQRDATTLRFGDDGRAHGKRGGMAIR